MTVRPATEADAFSIAAIWNPVIRETAFTFNSVEKTEDDLGRLIAARAASGHGFFVAEENGVLGFATYGQFRDGVGYRHTMEHTVMLAPDAQGRGHGRALMDAVENHARMNGAHSMFAGVSSGNPAGVAFHSGIGYRQVALLKEVGFKFGRWFDLHLMQKPL